MKIPAHPDHGLRTSWSRWIKIEALEAQVRLGQLDVARATELQPALAAWRGILRGVPSGPGRSSANGVGPVMEPLPEVHGYKWKGQLNGGAVLEGTQKYLWCRGPEPMGIITWKHSLLVVPVSGQWAA
jgi:hypothetical protein